MGKCYIIYNKYLKLFRVSVPSSKATSSVSDFFSFAFSRLSTIRLVNASTATRMHRTALADPPAMYCGPALAGYLLEVSKTSYV